MANGDQNYNVTINSDLGALDGSVLQYNGTGNFEAVMPAMSDIEGLEEELKLQKQTMNERLNAIEDQIILVRRDHILEEDYEELKAAWEAYNNLAEKLRTFKRLKDSA